MVIEAPGRKNPVTQIGKIYSVVAHNNCRGIACRRAGRQRWRAG